MSKKKQEQGELTGDEKDKHPFRRKQQKTASSKNFKEKISKENRVVGKSLIYKIHEEAKRSLEKLRQTKNQRH